MLNASKADFFSYQKCVREILLNSKEKNHELVEISTRFITSASIIDVNFNNLLNDQNRHAVLVYCDKFPASFCENTLRIGIIEQISRECVCSEVKDVVTIVEVDEKKTRRRKILLEDIDNYSKLIPRKKKKRKVYGS